MQKVQSELLSLKIIKVDIVLDITISAELNGKRLMMERAYEIRRYQIVMVVTSTSLNPLMTTG